MSVVGSRKVSPQGLARTRKLAAALVDRGMVVVSGLALGVDTAAHTTAIERGGKTIAGHTSLSPEPVGTHRGARPAREELDGELVGSSRSSPHAAKPR